MGTASERGRLSAAAPGARLTLATMNAIRRLGLWLGRLVLLLGMIAFAGAVALFSAVTYLELTEGGARSPISILTALLVPVCGVLAAGCWWLFTETFKRGGGAEAARASPASRRR